MRLILRSLAGYLSTSRRLARSRPVRNSSRSKFAVFDLSGLKIQFLLLYFSIFYPCETLKYGNAQINFEAR